MSKPTAQRLNPFALPSETTTRFILLVVAAASVAMFLGLLLADHLGLPSLAQLSVKIMEASMWPSPGTIDSPDSAAAYQQAWQKNQALLLDIFWIWASPLVLLVLVFVSAYVLYRLHPRLLRFRAAVRSPSSEQDSGLLQTVAALANLSETANVPQIEIKGDYKQPLHPRVFGFPRKYVLRIGGSWRLLHLKKPATFRAVILHEFAHIANRDVGRTYFSRALWVALSFIVIAPLFGVVLWKFGANTWSQLLAEGVTHFDWKHLWTESLPRLGFIATQMAVTLLMVAAVRASILRVREIYADWRVALWGMRNPLEELIAKQPLPPWWQRWYHPIPEVRLQALRDPTALFRLASDLAFFVGFFVSLLVISIALLPMLWIITQMTLTELQIAALLADPSTGDVVLNPGLLLVLTIAVVVIGLLLGLGYLWAYLLGIEVQRTALADLARGQHWLTPCLNLLRPALFAGLGMGVATVCAPYSAFVTTGPTALLLLPIWLLVFVGLIWLWLVYTYWVARSVLGSYAGAQAPHRQRRIVSFIVAALAAILFGPALYNLYIIVPLAASTGMLQSSVALQSVLSFLIYTLISYTVIVAATWIGIYLWQAARKSSCPHCNHLVMQHQTVDHYCPHCGSDLAAWLFVPAPSQSTSRLDPQPDSSQPPQRLPSGSPAFRAQVVAFTGTLLLASLAIYVIVSAGSWHLMTQQQVLQPPLPGGVYQVQGADPNGNSYTGTLILIPVEQIYKAAWQTSIGDYAGYGLHEDNIFATTFGSTELCSVVIYQVQPDAALYGRLTVPSRTDTGSEHAFPLTQTVGAVPSGTYTVSVPGVSENVYNGTLTITPTDGSYQLHWETNQVNFSGTGLLVGDKLAAVYGLPDQCGLVVYQIQANGSLDGTWIVQGQTLVGAERAAR